MDEAPRERLIEWAIDLTAAAILAASLAFAWLKLAGGGAGAAVTPALAFVATFAGLRRIGPGPATFKLPPLEHCQVPVETADEELILTPEMAIPGEPAADDSVLVLDDVLATLNPDSRVVQLFRPVPLPTAGELQATIERHLGTSSRRGVSEADATAELHQALAELRSSLR